MTLQDAIAALLEPRDLSEDEMGGVMRTIFAGEATPATIAAILVLLRRKGETVDEITGAARAMREHATAVTVNRSPLLDTCGTGGDGGGTFNVSTATAIVAAAGGCAVAKHGNRAMSGRVGGADVLEELGVDIELDPERMRRMIEECGFGFLFAPLLHEAMRHAGPVRRELGTRTIFNLLGPLTNPAGARRQLLGVFAPEWVEPLACVLHRLGAERALVVHGEDGLDEITITAPTRVAEVADGAVHAWEIVPEDLGFERAPASTIRVDGPAASAAMIRGIFAGEASPARDIVLLNAGAAFYVAGIAPTMAAGVEAAAETVDSGKARRKLEEIVTASQSRA